MALRPAVFLDKDGTLIENVPHNVEPSLMLFTPGAVEGLRLLHAHGFPIYVVTNQPGVAHGIFSEAALSEVERELRRMLMEIDVKLSGFYYCPHHPEGKILSYSYDCECRKPQPGMLVKAAKDNSIQLSSSWMVGDILHDIQAGRSAGCRTILLDRGNETEWLITEERRPDFVVKNLAGAARLIVYG
jgi:D-glycero-D-manno-heptose 1,7-bisphosphate phosphatase